MPQMGSFQTERLLLRRGRESFWIAKDAAGAACTLHILEPPEVWSIEQRAAAVGAFLACVEYQQKLALDTKAVARVESFGSNENGAFAVLEPAAESVARLISSKPMLSTPAVRKFTLGLLGDLTALRKAGRPHGNLTASTVLLTSTNIQLARPMLVSPSPGAAAEHDDMPALGRILFQLIQHREYSDRTGIGTDDTWRTLPDGEAWKQLIISLLAPEAGTTLESVKKAVPAGARRGRMPIYVAAAVMVAIGVGVAWHFLKPVPVVLPPADPELVAATQAADEAVRAAGPAMGGQDDADPSAALRNVLGVLAGQRDTTSPKFAPTVKSSLDAFPQPLEGVEKQLADLKGAFAALPNKGDYPNFPRFIDTLQTRLADLKAKPATDRTYFERAAQFGSVSNALFVLQRQLAVPNSPEILQRSFFIIIDHVCADAETGSMKQILASLKDQAFIKSGEIAQKKDTVAWGAIPEGTYPPSWAGLEKLEGDLLRYGKIAPDEIGSQAAGLVADINAKITTLKTKAPGLSDPLQGQLAAIRDDIKAKFIDNKPKAGAAFDAGGKLFWIARDYPAIQLALGEQRNRLNSLDADYAKFTGEDLKGWLAKFRADPNKLNESFFTYYNAKKAAYQADGWSIEQQFNWKGDFEKAFNDANAQIGQAQASLQSLTGALPKNPSGLEKDVADALAKKLDANRTRLAGLATAFDPDVLAAARAALASTEIELGCFVNLKTVAAQLAAPTFDVVAFRRNLDGLKPLDQDAELGPVVAPVHDLDRALAAMSAAADAPGLTAALTGINAVKVAGSALKPPVVESLLWGRFSELKSADEAVLQYQLSQIPAASRATPGALAAYVQLRLAADARPNLLLEAFLIPAIKGNDTKISDALASELTRLNAPANDRLTQIIAAMKVDANAAGTVGLLTHGWTEPAPGAADGTRSFVYSKPPAGKTLALKFRKLDNTQTYVCTTETPLLVLAALADTERSMLRSKADVGLFDKVDLKAGLTAAINGIVGFQKDDEIVASDWGTWTTPSDTVPGWSPPGAPTTDHPLQFVTPGMAAYVAVKTGTRLPTAAEWASADKMNKTAVPAYDANSNLSGPAWDAYVKLYQSEFVDKGANTSTLGNPLNVTNLIFEPRTKPANWGTMANPAKPWPTQIAAGKPKVDEILFLPVTSDAGTPFQNLIGNVAEFVFDPALNTKLAGVAVPADPEAGFTAVAGVVAANAGGVKVIGGSCLSPLGNIDNARTAFDVADVTKPYTDVGFRLAFDAGKTFTEQFAEHLNAVPAARIPANDLVRTILKNSAPSP